MLHSSKDPKLTFGYIIYDIDLNDFLSYFLARCKIQYRYDDTKKFCKLGKSCRCSRFFNDFLNASCKKSGYGLDLKSYPNGCTKPKFSMVKGIYTIFWIKCTISQLTSRF